jgi:hypothetical protein
MFSDANRSRHLPDHPVVRLACVIALWSLTGVASAQVKNVTAAEMAAVPRYCPFTHAFGRSGTPDNPSARSQTLGRDHGSRHSGTCTITAGGN